MEEVTRMLLPTRKPVVGRSGLAKRRKLGQADAGNPTIVARVEQSKKTSGKLFRNNDEDMAHGVELLQNFGEDLAKHRQAHEPKVLNREVREHLSKIVGASGSIAALPPFATAGRKTATMVVRSTFR